MNGFPINVDSIIINHSTIKRHMRKLLYAKLYAKFQVSYMRNYWIIEMFVRNAVQSVLNTGSPV